MIYENIRLALQTIGHNKVRSLLTMLGIIIAVWAVVLVVSIGEGIKSQVSSQIDELGSRLLTITPGQYVQRNESGEVESLDIAAAFTTSTMTVDDLEDIKANPSIEAAAPQMLVSGTVKVKDKKIDGSILIGTDEDLAKALNQKVEHGEFLTDGKSDTAVAVIGQGISDEYFNGSNPVGSVVEIRGEQFVVKGVMDKFSLGGAEFGPDINKAIFINLGKAREYANDIAAIQEIDALVKDGSDVDKTVTAITRNLKENQGGEENFSILKQEDLLSVTDDIFNLITSGIGLIAGISIVVGSIGIMNIMLVSVTERTREIGLRKAIGAYESQILQQFLIEAVVLSLVGGMIGLGLAWLSGLAISASSDLAPVINAGVLIQTLFGSAVIGIASGMWPAVKAARKNAIEALRHE